MIPVPLIHNLKPGDLLFQTLPCGKLCQTITATGAGEPTARFNHVAMLINKDNGGHVIEAITSGVSITPLQNFLMRSVNRYQQPRVQIERLRPAYQSLIPLALDQAKHWLHRPYNTLFTPNADKSFYCSQLITEAFRMANQGKPFFTPHRLIFANPQHPEVLAYWRHYYHQHHHPIPWHRWGSNPNNLAQQKNLWVLYSNYPNKKDA